MAVKKKSELSGVEKLREKIKKQEQEKRTANKSESNASNKTSLSGVEKLREKVRKENPSYRSSAPFFGGTTLPTKTEESTKPTTTTTNRNMSAPYTDNRNKGKAPTEHKSYNDRKNMVEKNREKLAKDEEVLTGKAKEKAEQAKAQSALSATPYTVKTDNVFSDMKSKIGGTTTIAGDFSEEERNARIKEINSELRELAKIRSGLSRASMYGNVSDRIAENEAKQTELREELKTLERTGTFTGTETLQWEIDDAKAEVQKWNNVIAKYGTRPNPDDPTELQNAYVQSQKAKEKLEVLENKKTLYKDISEYGEDINVDDFSGQTAANYRFSELTRYADKAMSNYMDNPTEENKEIAYAYDAFVREYQRNNSAALDDEGEILPWISKSAAGYMPQFLDQIVPQAIGGGVGALVGSAVGMPSVGAGIGAGLATGVQSYNVIRGSVYRALLAEGVDEKIAIEAANDEALISSLIEGGETMISFILAGGGKALGAIGTAAQKSLAKGSTNVATKFIANLAGKGINAAAAKASAPLWKTGVRMVGGVALNGGTEYLEEFTQQGVNIANKERAMQGDADSSLVAGTSKVIGNALTGKNPAALKEMHEAGVEGGKIGLMFGGTSTIVNNTITRFANAQSITEQNEILDSIVKDEAALKDFIEEGKANGKVSEKIAKEIEASMKNGKVTREQVRRLIASNDVYIENEEKINGEPDSLEQAARDVVESGNNASKSVRGASLEERLDALSSKNEPVAVAEVKNATRMGDHGAVLVTEIANQDGVTFTQAKKMVETAYRLGFTDVDIEKVSFTNDTQKLAFEAGKQDRHIDDIMQAEKAKKASVFESGFTENEYSAKLTSDEREMFSILAKDLKMDVEIVDRIIASRVKGRIYEANASHTDGKMRVSSTSEKTMLEVAMHEGGHRMRQLAPEAFGELMNFIYENSEHNAQRLKLGVTGVSLFDQVKEEHDNANIKKGTGDYIEEIAARKLESILTSPEEFLAWRKTLDQNPQMKSKWQEFLEIVKRVLEDVWAAITNSKMSLEAKRKAQAEIEQTKDLLANAYKAAMKAADERSQEVQGKNLQNDVKNNTNDDYTVDTNHSLKKRNRFRSEEDWHTDLSKDQVIRVEGWLRRAGVPESKQITDTAYWYTGRIDGEDLFVIYSTEDSSGPTILYERKGKEAKTELNTLLNYLEEIENGESSVEKSSYVNWVSGGGWMQQANGVQNSPPSQRGRSYKNVGVLQGQSQSNASGALWNVIDDLLGEQGEVIPEPKVSHSLKNNNDVFTDIAGKERIVLKTTSGFSVSGTRKYNSHYPSAQEAIDAENENIKSYYAKKLSVKRSYIDKMLAIDEQFLAKLSTQNASYSLKDSAGKTLTKEQAEFFKDSKIKNNKGNLLKVYHATDAEFYTFDKSKIGSGSGSSFGRGFYFATSRDLAENYGENVGEYYLNITNPYNYYSVDKDYIVDMLEKSGYDYDKDFVNSYDFDELWDDDFIDVFLPKAIKGKNPYSIFSDMVQKAGFDGIWADSEIVAFDSEQAKLTSNEKPTSNPDTRYSLKDSKGNTLTEEQAEYFKGSKVRDENGTLKVVYHGTRKADFTVFKRNINFFTDNKEMADSYSPAGEMYEGYLNITKPYEIDAAGEKWSKVPIDEATKQFLQEYGAGVFKEGGKWRTTPADIAAAIEEAVDNGDLDYDGIIIKNIDDTGSYYKGKGNHLGTDYIVFNSNQFKNADNTNPTSNPDIRFSLKKSVEETKDLIAVHNVFESKLREALKLGGLPSPSIAITKKDFSHNKFGEISLIFRKETISPTDRRNKVYGGDAYTPTRQQIDYKINDKALNKLADRVKNLVDYDIRSAFRLMLDDSNVTDDIRNANGNFVEAYKNNEALKIAFLKDKGIPFKPVMKIKQITQAADNVVLRKVSRAIGEATLKKAAQDSKLAFAQEPMIRKLMNDRMEEQGAPRIYDKELSAYEVSNIIYGALDYIREGDKKTVDYYATRDRLTGKFTKKLTAEYEKWLAELGEGIVEKKGIRNEVDLFTPSGNRRSFEALHWDYTLENIVRAMNAKQSKGDAAWGGNVFGASTKEYSSIAEIKADSSRLQQMTDEEYEAMKSEYKERLSDIASAYANGKSYYDAEDALIEAIATKKTKQGMRSYLAQFDYVYKVTDDIVNDLWELRNDIAEMPVSYFEAKPQRAVSFDEVVAAVIPRTKDKSLKSELEARGMKVLEYDKNKDGDRVKKLNSVSDVAFSLKKDPNATSSQDVSKLLDTIEQLKHEFELTKFAKADPKKLAAMTKKLIKDYDSQVDYDETYKAIDELYTYIANGEDGHPAVWEDVYEKASEIANKIVDYAIAVDDEMYRDYKGLREYLRTTPMRFYKEFDSVPSGYENFNDFRRRNFGRFNFTNDGMSIDRVYEELSELYPEFFDGSEQLNVADKLERIVDVLDDIQPREYNPYSSEFKTVSAYLANDIINRFFDIPQAKPTFADKAERKLIKTHIEARKKLDKVRAQRDAKIQKEKQKRKDAISKMSENQKAKVLRARIMRHASDLSQKLIRPSDNQHIPQNLQGAVATLLEHINLESNYTYDVTSGSYKKNDEGLPSKRTAAFTQLRELYRTMESTLTIDPDLICEGGLLSEVIALNDKRIADMNSSELDTIWQAIRAIEATISSANKMFSEGKYAAISEVANALRVDNDGKNVKKELRVGGRIQTLTSLNMLTPETYFHYLGEAGDAIFRMMRNAQDKHISVMKEVSDFTHEELKGVNVNKIEKTLHTVTLGGENVTLSTAQLMELYVLMKRKQAVEHILLGGILPDEIDKGLFKNNRAEPIRKITQEEIGRALSKLTAEEKAVADKMQKFVSTVLSQHGNEASMKVYNYEKFLEENYWTIRTNKQEIASDVGKDTAVTSVANKGMAKGTVPHANTSVRIGSIFDTFSAHSSDMATYAAWLGTTEDINRIRNFVFWEEGARTGTVKGILDTVHGTQGSQYLHKLLTDISIGVRGTDNMNPLERLTGHYKAASVGANIRVIIQQPTAILRALDMIDAQYLAVGAIRPIKGWENAKKYAPIAQWKDWGHFDINTGRQMKDVLFNNASLLEKTKQVGMWGASVSDSIAWGQLWNAVEAETKAKHKDLTVGSEEYYNIVAKRFTEIVDHTQVVDGILQRSGVMRSSDALTKMATSFMGEPTKQYNMAMAAAYDVRTKKGKEKLNAVGRLGRTAAGLAIAGIVNAAAQSIIDALRDDDKEKDYWEKWLKAFMGDGDETNLLDSNLGDTANPLNYVPFAKDIVSIFKGYDVKRMDAEAITKTFNAVTNMHKAVSGTGKYTIAEASAALFAEIARLYGVPVANVKRDIKSAVMTVAIQSDNYLMQYRIEKAMLDINYAGNSKNFMDILFNAYQNDRAAYEFIYKDMLKSGYEADKIQSGMETRMKKAEGVSKASELTKRYMTPADEKKYDNSLKKLQASKPWKSANAEQKKNAEANLYNFLTSTSEGMEKIRVEARAFGVDETEYTLWQLAKEMSDDGNGLLNAREKAKAVEMLDLNNSELAYFYGTETSDTAYAYGLSIENFAMFKGAVSELENSEAWKRYSDEQKKAAKIAEANKYASNEKEYLFFIGTEYSSYKKRSDYISYFGK